MQDDPELDGTDGAHPAWWRGCDHGANAVARELIRVLQTGDSPGIAQGDVQTARQIAQELWRLANLSSLDRAYLRTLVREMAKRRCERKVCGTVCLCEPCTARLLQPKLFRGSDESKG